MSGVEVYDSSTDLVVAPIASMGSDAVDMDLMMRFESLAKAFKGEVQGIMDHEKQTARDDLNQRVENNKILEAKLKSEGEEIVAMTSALWNFVRERQGNYAEQIFGADGVAEAPALDAQSFRAALDAFFLVNRASIRPEIEEAQKQKDKLRRSIQEREAELEKLCEELAEARVLKLEEEQELHEFDLLREKDAEVQACLLEVQQVQSQLKEAKANNCQLNARDVHNESVQREKSGKIMELVKRIEDQSEQVRLLSDEHNTLRLESGRDLDYLKIVIPPSDPVSYCCTAGTLSEELKCEETRFADDLIAQSIKFPGLPAGGGHCRDWCTLQIDRLVGFYRSFLHRHQDFTRSLPQDCGVYMQEVNSDWTGLENGNARADKEFYDAENLDADKWEEHRSKLVLERNSKVVQLLEQAERSQSTAEKQLLLQQAKLYGQRIDTQIERAWEEQRKERSLRWTEHQQWKADIRQKVKDESLSAQQLIEENAAMSNRFEDAVNNRLAAVEDAWLQSCDKELIVNISVLKGHDLQVCLRSVLRREPKLPCKGSQHTGLGLIVDEVVEMFSLRSTTRKKLQKELEEQSLQQLKGCIEKFIQKEAAQKKILKPHLEEVSLEFAQGAVIVSSLQRQQHHHFCDALKRHLYDFLVVLRIVSLASIWLMPEKLKKCHLAANKSCDLTPLPTILKKDGERHDDSAPSADATQDPSDVGEAKSLYDRLCQCLLERVLTAMNSSHREELLRLKRAYAAEQRLALQSFCQLDSDAIARIVEREFKEYGSQVSTRLLAECEYHICEERKQLLAQVDNDVDIFVAKRKHEIEEEEQVIVKDRRKWLTDRIVVLQASGSSGPNERALLQRLRQELRSCESKIELYNNEFVPRMSNAPQEPQNRGRSSSLFSSNLRAQSPQRGKLNELRQLSCISGSLPPQAAQSWVVQQNSRAASPRFGPGESRSHEPIQSQCLCEPPFDPTVTFSSRQPLFQAPTLQSSQTQQNSRSSSVPSTMSRMRPLDGHASSHMLPRDSRLPSGLAKRGDFNTSFSAEPCRLIPMARRAPQILPPMQVPQPHA